MNNSKINRAKIQKMIVPLRINKPNRKILFDVIIWEVDAELWLSCRILLGRCPNSGFVYPMRHQQRLFLHREGMVVERGTGGILQKAVPPIEVRMSSMYSHRIDSVRQIFNVAILKYIVQIFVIKWYNIPLFCAVSLFSILKPIKNTMIRI